MFQIISEVINVAARTPGPHDYAPRRKALRPTLRALIWRRRG